MWLGRLGTHFVFRGTLTPSYLLPPTFFNLAVLLSFYRFMDLAGLSTRLALFELPSTLTQRWLDGCYGHRSFQSQPSWGLLHPRYFQIPQEPLPVSRSFSFCSSPSTFLQPFTSSFSLYRALPPFTLSSLLASFHLLIHHRIPFELAMKNWKAEKPRHSLLTSVFSRRWPYLANLQKPRLDGYKGRSSSSEAAFFSLLSLFAPSEERRPQ